MYLVYKILSCLRYLLHKKKIKKLITLAMIIVLLSMLCSRVFAFELEVDSGDSLTFDDISELNTSSNINDYYIIIFDLKNTSNARSSRYWAYFFPKSTFNDFVFAYDIYSTDNISYYSINFLANTSITYYCVFYNKNNNKFVKRNGWSETRATDVNGFLSYFNGKTSEHDVFYCNFDMTTLFLANLQDFSVTLSTEEQTEGPLYLYTNYFDTNYSSNISASVVLYPDTPESLVIDLSNTTEVNPENATRYRYYFEVPENGVYDVVFNFNYNDYFNTRTIRKTVTNLIVKPSGGNERRRRFRRWRE